MSFRDYQACLNINYQHDLQEETKLNFIFKRFVLLEILLKTEINSKSPCKFYLQVNLKTVGFPFTFRMIKLTQLRWRSRRVPAGRLRLQRLHRRPGQLPPCRWWPPWRTPAAGPETAVSLAAEQWPGRAVSRGH